MARRIDATPLAEKPRAATDIDAERTALRADFVAIDRGTTRAAMQRAAVDIDAEPIARLERRALEGTRRGRGIAADGHDREVILQALRTAEQERSDPGGARAPQHPDHPARRHDSQLPYVWQ
jgi:hypothetical protein